MRSCLLLLLSLCSAIVRSNDTLDNAIPVDEDSTVRAEDPQQDIYNNQTLKEIFDEAVEAYLDEDWDRCVEGFNRALHGYKAYKRMVINCRRKCRVQADGATPFFPEDIEDLHFYEKKVRETLCLLTCNQDYREIAGTRALNRLPRELEKKFVEHRPYEYLHICYFKRNRYQDAANTILTFLVRYPGHEPSIETLKHYLTLPNVREEDVVNLEAAPFVAMYFKGVIAYEDENYMEAAGLFESSLRSYMESEDECRVYCEGPFDQGWHPEFTSSLANHFAYCLKCKRGCSHRLNSVNGDYRSDMLRSHYDYLQFSYYKLGKLKAACAAVESYLLFAPADETMLHNKKYYAAQPKAREEYFTPREEALSYVKRQMYEKRLLGYISQEFLAVDKRFDALMKNEAQKKGKAEENKEKEEELGKVKSG